MPKKKNPDETKPKVTNPNVMGLRAEVLEQPITETLEINYMPYAMSRHRLPGHPGDRRLQALPPEAALHHVSDEPAGRAPVPRAPT